MTKQELRKYRKEARQEGLNDNCTADILCDAALSYIDSNVFEELTDDEHDQLIEDYIQGFVSGFIKTNKPK